MKKPVSIHSPGQLTVLAALLAGLCAPALAASDVVISQVYGAGGNSGSVLKNDYVELFNRTGAAIDIGGWAVQYASATGSSWQVTTIPAGKSIGPLQYFIVREAAQGAGTTDVPADVSGGIPMAAGAGKVALTNNSTQLTGGAPSGGAVVDFVGFGTTANAFEGAGPTPAPTVANAVFRKLGGCTDTDSNSGDFAAATAAPRSSTSAANSCPGVTPAAAPIVITSCPATLTFAAGTGASAGLAATDSDSIVNGVSIFSGAVPGISLSGFSPAAAANGSATVNLTVDASVASGNYPVVVRFTNSDSQIKDCSVTIKGEGVHTIPQIQGSGASSPFADSVQTTQGVITLKVGSGFFMQDLNGDGDPTTSDGIFVFGGTTSAGAGDLVRVKGTVAEFRPANATRTYTELKDIASIETLGSGYSITPTPVVMPTDLAQVEGMLVKFSNPLIINSVSSLGDRGEMTLASVRREVPTNHYPAGSQAALDLARNNAIDQIVLDDGIFTQSPTIPYIGADQTVRVGDSVTDLVGLVDYGSIGNSQAGFKLQPLSVPSVTISRTNPRTAGPVVPAGNVRVASANVLNFFTTFTNGFNYLTKTTTGCGIGTPVKFANSNCRGADSETEFLRQRDKIVNELVALNADVVGLMEIQNNGDLTVSYLVDALNTKLGSVQYTYVPNVPSPGDDAIRVAMIYRPSVVTAVGAPMSDDVPINNRAPIAQTFKANNNGGKFSVIVNHLKSKGSCPGGTGVDADHNDSQGCWNGTRIQQAQRLVGSFIPAVKAASGDDDVLLIGDFNSHGFEDPINLLTANGIVNELERFVRPEGIVYSYVFDSLSGYLDHALASTSLDGQVAGATEWHNNADEPDAIDYNLDGKPQDLYVNNAYRASDHDPVVISLNLTPTFVDSTASFSVVRSAFIMNRQTGLFSGSYSFTNKTGAAINGPFQLEIAGLPAGVTLTNASGAHNGVPYITASAASVAPGATATVTLVLSNPNKVALNYAATIYSGTF
jgi:predicted extracellular nuclease